MYSVTPQNIQWNNLTKPLSNFRESPLCPLVLTLKAPITTAADDNIVDIFPNF